MGLGQTFSGIVIANAECLSRSFGNESHFVVLHLVGGILFDSEYPLTWLLACNNISCEKHFRRPVHPWETKWTHSIASYSNSKKSQCTAHKVIAVYGDMQEESRRYTTNMGYGRTRPTPWDLRNHT
jgi:hypothetical protein